MDLEKFIKILKLTTSPHDGEALSAIRMANSYIKKENKSWDQMFGIKQTKKEFSLYTATVDELFVEIEERGLLNDFAESIRDFYEERGFISVKQKQALKNMLEDDFGED